MPSAHWLATVDSQPFAILTLALGIGANTAIFSLINGVLLQSVPFTHPEQLVTIAERIPKLAHQMPSLPVNGRHLLAWRRQSKSLEHISAIDSRRTTLTGAGEPEQIGAALVTASLFPLLGAQPRLGRAFVDEEDRPGKNRVVMLADSLWRRRSCCPPRNMPTGVSGSDSTTATRKVEVDPKRSVCRTRQCLAPGGGRLGRRRHARRRTPLNDGTTDRKLSLRLPWILRSHGHSPHKGPEYRRSRPELSARSRFRNTGTAPLPRPGSPGPKVRPRRGGREAFREHWSGSRYPHCQYRAHATNGCLCTFLVSQPHEILTCDPDAGRPDHDCSSNPHSGPRT